MANFLVLLSLLTSFTVATATADCHARSSSTTTERSLKLQSVSYGAHKRIPDGLTSGASRGGRRGREYRSPTEKVYSHLGDLLGKMDFRWILSVLAVLVAYLTLREYRLGRRQSVKPFLIVKMAGSDLKDYRLLLKNEGIGIAFDVNIFLEEPDRLLGSLDFIQAGTEREITVQLLDDSSLVSSRFRTIVLKYHDIYGTKFRSRFLFRMSSMAIYSLPDPSSVELQEFSEKPRYARKTTLRLGR